MFDELNEEEKLPVVYPPLFALLLIFWFVSYYAMLDYGFEKSIGQGPFWAMLISLIGTTLLCFMRFEKLMKLGYLLVAIGIALLMLCGLAS
jgi:hypothetical protein